MDDKDIVDLYLQRDETAINETQIKYGSYCYTIANNILSIHEDAEECVNDTWISAWNKIPPIIPKSMKAFLGKIVRDISLSRYRANHALKRYGGMDVILNELEECIPSDFNVQRQLEQKELDDLINEWLESLHREDRVLFIKRYYNGETVKSLARVQACTENQMAQRMLKLRNNLKSFLTSKGVSI